MARRLHIPILALVLLCIALGGARGAVDSVEAPSTTAPKIINGQGEDETQKAFLNRLLEDYDINEWPHEHLKLPTVVHVQMFLHSFGSLNAANMDYTIDVFLRQFWVDPRLAFSDTGRDQIIISNPELQRRLWKPDTYFDNVKEASFHTVTMPNVLLRISKTGDILYSMRVTLKLACNMDLEDYPFDAQICQTALASYANTDDIIVYKWQEKTPIDVPDNLEIAQFDLLNYYTANKTNIYAVGNYSTLQAFFNLRRQNGYHILQTYVPTILIVSISWVSFWLDPNAVPARVSLGVTTLLTLTTLASGIRQSLPPVSYVKAIDVWVGVCMIMVFGALLQFTLVNWLANKKYTAIATPMTVLKQEAEGGPPTTVVELPKTYIAWARYLDRVCRAAFPLFFICFNIIYWPYYLVLDTSD
ncbi:glycine receptor subunit alphaZ1-like isoform X1 [Oratosquilla oratoria]|uniref:glycine receptor subunit alphaZ1-like isoform X1 n=1 Tax=Oratosquilla oratoria TaxID=337810 RepID=UPI003F76D2F3